MHKVRAVLLAGGEGKRMGVLGRGRSKPLIPFGGCCRLIDFSMANAYRSGLEEVLLLSQYEERMLMDDLHLTWNVRGGCRVHFGPYDEAYRRVISGQLPAVINERCWPAEKGTADALLSKGTYIFGKEWTEVLVLHADHVYQFDYREMVQQHRRSRAALTVSFQRIERRFVHLFGMVHFDTQGNLTDFVEKPEDPTSDLVFAAFCIFDAGVLRSYLDELSGTDWQHDISRDVIPAMLRGGERIRGYEVREYWEDIGTLDRYYSTHQALLRAEAPMPLSGMPMTIRPDVKRHRLEHAQGIRTCIVADDLVNKGFLTHCTVFPGVRVEKDAWVSESVLLPGAVVLAGSRIEGAVVLEDGTIVPCVGEQRLTGLVPR